jgi:hypothetical protein
MRTSEIDFIYWSAKVINAGFSVIACRATCVWIDRTLSWHTLARTCRNIAIVVSAWITITARNWVVHTKTCHRVARIIGAKVVVVTVLQGIQASLQKWVTSIVCA